MDGSKIILLPNVETGLLVNMPACFSLLFFFVHHFIFGCDSCAFLSWYIKLCVFHAKTNSPRLEVKLMMETHIVRKQKRRRRCRKKTIAATKPIEIIMLLSGNERKKIVQSDLRECYCYFGDFSASKPSSASHNRYCSFVRCCVFHLVECFSSLNLDHVDLFLTNKKRSRNT